MFVLPGLFLSVCFLFFISVTVVLAGIIGALVGSVGTVLDPANSSIVAELVSNTLNSGFLFSCTVSWC